MKRHGDTRVGDRVRITGFPVPAVVVEVRTEDDGRFTIVYEFPHGGLYKHTDNPDARFIA